MKKAAPKLIMLLAVLAALALVVAFAGCKPKVDPTPAPSGGGDDPNPVVEWSMSTDCTVCHTKEAGTMTSAGTLAQVHAKAGDTCVDCHTDEATLKTVHDGKTADSKKPKFLKKTEVGEATCLSSACHDTTVEALIAKTADCAIFTDSKGTTVNPHTAIDLNDDHKASLECASCHAMHTDGYGDTVTFQQVCLGCHHQDVYECHTCH